MLSRLLCWQQPSPYLLAPAIWAGRLAAETLNLDQLGQKVTHGSFQLLQFSAFCPKKQECAASQAVRSPLDGALPLCCGARKAHASTPAGCQRSAEVSGATKTCSSRKSTALCFLCPLCSPIIFIILCFKTDV